MKKMMIAVAMTIALPAGAFAQATPAPSDAPSTAHAGHDMSTMDCKDMHAKMKMSGSNSGHEMSAADHSKMDHSKMDHSKMGGACAGTAKAGAKQVPADPHASHQQ